MELKEVINVSDMVIGAEYYDVPPGQDHQIATRFKLVGKSTLLSFEHVSGPVEGYETNRDGLYEFPCHGTPWYQAE